MSDSLYIPRQLVQRWVDNTDFFEDLRGKSMTEIDKAKKDDDLITEELRAILAAPVVERQEPVAFVRITEGNPKVSLFSWVQKVPLPVGKYQLYTSPPAPVAVVLPDHEFRETVNRLRAISEMYGHTDQLRERISMELRACLGKVKELNQ